MIYRLLVLLITLNFLTSCISKEVKEPKDGPVLVEIPFSFNIPQDSLKEGDIVLRNGIGLESELIKELTGSLYSHAGLIVKDGTNKYVVDNYPGRPSGSIAKITIQQFFSHASGGGVWRYNPNRTVPSGASTWAIAQIGTSYEFDLFDEYTNNNKKQYCSEFVWRAYVTGGDDLVPTPINLKGANLATTLAALRKFANEEHPMIPEGIINGKVDDYVDNHSGLFIAPGQLDTATQTSKKF